MGLLILVRHAATDAIGQRLVGRLPGVALNALGARQAELLSRALRPLPLAAIYSSPLERALDTAAALATSRVLDVGVRPGLNELDFGDWTGLGFDELRERDDFREFNRRRTASRPPGGESIRDVQQRMVAEAEHVHRLHRAGHVALVGHGDPLRALLCHYLRTSLDDLDRFELAPASVSVVDAERGVVLSLGGSGAGLVQA